MGANAPRVSGRHRMAETGTGSVSGRRTRVARGPKGDAELLLLSGGQQGRGLQLDQAPRRSAAPAKSRFRFR